MEDVARVLLSILIVLVSGWCVTVVMVRVLFPFKVTKRKSVRFEVKNVRGIRYKGMLSTR